MAGGPAEIFGVLMWNSTEPTQPPMFHKVGDNFYPLLGSIIIQWATMEQEMECLISALMTVNGTTEPGGKRQFSRRWRLMREQFKIFATGEPALMKEMNEIERLVNTVKQVRDGIAHTNIMMGIDDEGPLLRFNLSEPFNPWSKKYHLDDLKKLSKNITEATGRIYRLANPNHPTSAALPGRSLLQQLPNMNHQRFPMRPERSRPCGA